MNDILGFYCEHTGHAEEPCSNVAALRAQVKDAEEVNTLMWENHPCRVCSYYGNHDCNKCTDREMKKRFLAYRAKYGEVE